jgi:RNA polymerase sigma-70 factor (ECF subfamily)
MSNHPNHSSVTVWVDDMNAGHSTSEPSARVFGAEAGAIVDSRDVACWSDAQLISAVRCDPPDEAALDVLVVRYWSSLFGRCKTLTLNHEKALDLAQAAWCRLLRNRHALKPDGNFKAYLITIAKNLFRDSCRTARRAGPMADNRLKSLDDEYANEDGETVVLMDIVPDLKSLQTQEQMLLAMDIRRALKHLPPQLREVLLAHFIEGESCVEIGLRYGRTKQCVNGWVREALRQIKTYLEEPSSTHDPKNDWRFESSCTTGAFSGAQCETNNR